MTNLCVLFTDFHKLSTLRKRSQFDNAEILVLEPSVLCETSKVKQKNFIFTYFCVWCEKYPPWRVNLFKILDLILEFVPTDLIEEIMNYHSSFLKENKVMIEEGSCERCALRTDPENWEFESASWKFFFFLWVGLDSLANS